MDRRSHRFLLPAILLVFVILIAGGVATFFYLRQTTHVDSTTNIPPLPTPGSARMTYTNSQFGYTIRYPAQWFLNASGDNTLVRVFLSHSLGAPEAVAFEIHCFPDPYQLNAQQLWQETQPPGGSETGVGLTTFPSGVSAYEAKGQGQTSYTVYTMVNNQVACQGMLYQTDALNARVELATLNTFSWQ